MIQLNHPASMIDIDGNTGEGGGQIIRTALALSMITGIPIQIDNIRAGRKKSGLLRQHLMCVQASAQISDAVVTGAALGSSTLTFAPQQVKHGDYTFDIGSAGSTSLVLQTILPALLFARHTNVVDDAGNQADNQTNNETGNQADNQTNNETGNETDHQTGNQTDSTSTITIIGGTHNPLAPTTDFLQLAFVPALEQMGWTDAVTIDLLQTGYAPVGGGKIKVTIKTNTNPVLDRPATIKPVTGKTRLKTSFDLTKRGELLGIELVASHLNLDKDICNRELASTKEWLIKHGVDEDLIHTKSVRQNGIGEGNSCYAVVRHGITGGGGLNAQGLLQVHTEVFSVLGEKHTSAEKVGKRLAGLVKRYLYKTAALVDEYTTDQLLLPLALLCTQNASTSQFTARMISEHSKTQAWLIEQFLPVSISFEPLSNASDVSVTNKASKNRTSENEASEDAATVLVRIVRNKDDR